MKTNEELDALFAEHVAGKFVAPNGRVYRSREAYEIEPLNGSSPIAPYTTDANAVLPYLEKWANEIPGKRFVNVEFQGNWRVMLTQNTPVRETVVEFDYTASRPAVIALLLANGIEV